MTAYRLDKMLGKLRRDAPDLPSALKSRIMAEVDSSPVAAVRRPFWRYAVGITALLLWSGVGTVFASQQSLPGDALYPVKRATETAFVNILPSAPAKTVAQEWVIERRNEEAETAIERQAEPSAPAAESDDLFIREAERASDAWVNQQERNFDAQMAKRFREDDAFVPPARIEKKPPAKNRDFRRLR